MASRPSNLPDYDQPPVIEVAFSLQYSEDIVGYSMAHAGRFWTDLGDEFSHVAEVPLINSSIERADGTLRGVQIGGSLPPTRRLQIYHGSDGWIVQLQPDRFILNWKADRPGAVYPRFEACFTRFMEYRGRFERFCDELDLKVPRPNQYELAYVNHVQKGQGWNSPADVGSIFPDIVWRNDREFLPTPSSISWSAIFNMPDESGRLHASIKTAKKKPKDTELFLLELTARGYPIRETEDSQESWFRLAREWIVKGFADLTDKEIQSSIWKRTR